MRHLIVEPCIYVDYRGFFSFVNQYLSACYYYRNDDVYVSFDLTKKSKYYDPSISDTENVWEYFFKVQAPENVPIERAVWGQFGNRYSYTFDYNNLNDRINAEEVINKHLLINSKILDKINKFYDENFKGKKILGIHKRGTDIGLHHDVKSLNDYFNEVDNHIQNYDALFISTDERSVIDKFSERYENVIFNSYESLSTNPDLPNFLAPNVSGYKMGEDVLIDAYLLSKTDFLIQTNSNLSNFSLLANSKLNFKRIL